MRSAMNANAPFNPAVNVRPVEVRMTVGGRPLKMRVDVPTGPITPAALLPLYRSLVDRLMVMSFKATEEAGKPISCRKGCAACCRQVVAVSALEARELMKAVQRLPEPLQSRVRQRFAEARRRLQAEAPHLIPRLQYPQEFPLDQAATFEMAREYLRLWIDCPFLEDEACTIYHERPVTCRQYAVVSAPEHCATLSDDVRALEPTGGAASQWMPVWERTRAGHPANYIALVVAPDFVEEHPAEPPARPGTEIFNEFITRMLQRGKWEKPK